MINTTAEYKQAMKEGKRALLAKASCLLKNGTMLNFDHTNIMVGGLSITDGVCSSGNFDLGSAIINQLTLKINNMDEEYSSYDFTDAQITVWEGAQLSSGPEWLKKGVFNASDPTETPAVITLKALDNMAKFDSDYDGNMTFPITIQAMVQYCCDRCGVILATQLISNGRYVIHKNPFSDAQITYRTIISHCAVIAGCFARCNADGQLELKWYDKTAFSEASKHHEITQIASGLSVMSVDVTITGIKVTSEGDEKEKETYLSGTEGYVLSVSGNPLIQPGDTKTIASYLAEKIVGMCFRPMKANAVGDPSWEAGDAAVITDRKGKKYNCYLTNIAYAIGQRAVISCDAQPASRKSADRYDKINKVIAEIKKNVQSQLTEYGKYFDQMNSLAINAMGYYETVEIQDDGSKITYMHDKPNLSESKTVYKKSIDGYFWSNDGGKTWTSGIDKNGNAVMNVIAAIGLRAEWIKAGKIQVEDSDGKIIFLVDMDTKRVIISGDSVQIGGRPVQDVINSGISESKNYSDKQLADYANTVTKDLENLQAQVDGQVEDYYYDYEPSMQNIPASQWTTTEKRQKHIGDRFFWKSKGYAYRFMENGGVWGWTLLQDTDITKAMQTAQSAKDTADAKRRNFLVTPYPPYDIGDSWIRNDGEIMTCTTSRSSGNYIASDWEKINRYTDDAELKAFINGDFLSTIESLKESLDKKAETWYQATDPALNWTETKEAPLQDNNGENITDSDGKQIVTIWEYEKYAHEGDLWHNTTNNKEYIYQSGHWIEKSIPDDVFDEIDGKAQIFVKEPVPPYDVGDAWFTGAEILICSTKRTSGSFAKSDWSKREKYTDDTALTGFLNGAYKETIQELQNQVDGKAETWRQAEDPALNWTTAEEKANHKGDLWYNTGTGKAYIYSGAEWTIMTAQPPEEVFDEIDGKASVFVSQPKPPYRVGDLWFNGVTADIMTCKATRLSGNYNSADWEKRNKYTDDTAADKAQNAADNAQSAAEEADRKAQEAMEAAALARNMTLTLTNDYQTISVDANGNYGTFPSGITTAPIVMYGKQDITADCSYTITKSDSMQGTWDSTKRVFTVTEITADNAWVDIKAAYLGTLAITRRFTVSKLYSGKDGGKGDPGKDAPEKYTWIMYASRPDGLDMSESDEYVPLLDTDGNKILDSDGKVIYTYPNAVSYMGVAYNKTSATPSDNPKDYQWSKIKGEPGEPGRTYFISLSVNTLKRGQDGLLTPDEITANAYYRDGKTAETYPCIGRFKLQASKDGKAYSDISKSSGDFSGTRFTKLNTISKDYMFFRVNFYQPGGFTELIDTQTIPVLIDVAALTHKDVFDLLTNNGAWKGIYQEGGELYINLTYAKGEQLSGDMIDARNLEVTNTAGQKTFAVDNNGNVDMNVRSLSILGSAIASEAYADRQSGNLIKGVNLTESEINQFWDVSGDLTYNQADPMKGNGAIMLEVPIFGSDGSSDDCFVSAKYSNNNPITAPGVYEARVWLKADTNKTIKISINRTVFNCDVTTAWKQHRFMLDVKTPNTQGFQNFTIGGWGSITAGDVIYIYKPEVIISYSPTDILNLLTNNGAMDGVFIRNGQLYVKGSYIDVDDLKALKATIGGFIIGGGGIYKGCTSLASTGQGVYMGTDGLRLYSKDSSSNEISFTFDLAKKAISLIGTSLLFKMRNFSDKATLDGSDGTITCKYGLHVYTKREPDISDGSYDSELVFKGLPHITSGTTLVRESNSARICTASSSSKRYKEHIAIMKDYEAEKLLDIPVVWFKYKEGYLAKEDRFVDKPLPGFYAEDVFRVFPECAMQNPDTSVEDWNYRTLIPPMLKLIQNLYKEVKTLKENAK